MFVIIEGCDATGKSTLAAKVAEVGDAEISHSGPPPEGDPYYWARVLTEYRTNWHSQVWDRFHWGNIVYGPLYGNQRVMEHYEFEYYRQLVKAVGALTVIATGKASTVAKRALAEKEEFINLEDVAEIIARFESMSIVWDNGEAWSHEIDGIEAEPQGVINLALQQERVVRMIPGHQWIGSPTPQVVFVTEDALRDELPFAPKPSEYPVPFWSALTVLNSQHVDYSVVSSDSDLARYFLSVPGNPAIVSLGKKAGDRVKLYGLHTAIVRRPEDVDLGETKEYADKLRAAMVIGNGVYY